MRKLNIFLAILIAINITACDSKLEDLKKEKITKDINQSLENNESIIIPITKTSSEIYPSKITKNNQSFIFSDDINIT
ncbi:hypothetical protein ACM1UN_001141 [Campylobacter jejuni]